MWLPLPASEATISDELIYDRLFAKAPLACDLSVKISVLASLGTEKDIRVLIREISPENADLLISLGMFESGLNPAKINWNDNGSPSYSLYQFKTGTWQTFCKGDIMSAENQIQCADKMLNAKLYSHWYNFFKVGGY